MKFVFVVCQVKYIGTKLQITYFHLIKDFFKKQTEEWN